jgi:hypothetical protein
MRPHRPEPLAWADHLEVISGRTSQGPKPPGFPPDSLLRAAREGVSPERELWQSVAAGGGPGTLDLAAEGPLWKPDRWAAIEVWTESELCGLHALGRCLRMAPDAAVSRRVSSAIRWHLEHTQPDNATHRPWAIHLFLGHPDREVDLYGQTLLHNFEAAGRGDLDAAWILADAAREIRLDPAVATRW